MTPPDPQPTAPPTVAPASDAYVEELKKQTQHIEGFIAHTLIARIESDRAEMAEDADLIVRQNATISKQAEEIAGLRARVAELEAALSKLEKGIFDLTSDSPICQLHRLKLSALVDFIRAALKPEPPKEKL